MDSILLLKFFVGQVLRAWLRSDSILVPNLHGIRSRRSEAWLDFRVKRASCFRDQTRSTGGLWLRYRRSRHENYYSLLASSSIGFLEPTFLSRRLCGVRGDDLRD